MKKTGILFAAIFTIAGCNSGSGGADNSTSSASRLKSNTEQINNVVNYNFEFGNIHHAETFPNPSFIPASGAYVKADFCYKDKAKGCYSKTFSEDKTTPIGDYWNQSYRWTMRLAQIINQDAELSRLMRVGSKDSDTGIITEIASSFKNTIYLNEAGKSEIDYMTLDLYDSKSNKPLTAMGIYNKNSLEFTKDLDAVSGPNLDSGDVLNVTIENANGQILESYKITVTGVPGSSDSTTDNFRWPKIVADKINNYSKYFMIGERNISGVITSIASSHRNHIFSKSGPTDVKLNIVSNHRGTLVSTKMDRVTTSPASSVVSSINVISSEHFNKIVVGHDSILRGITYDGVEWLDDSGKLIKRVETTLSTVPKGGDKVLPPTTISLDAADNAYTVSETSTQCTTSTSKCYAYIVRKFGADGRTEWQAKHYGPISNTLTKGMIVNDDLQLLHIPLPSKMEAISMENGVLKWEQKGEYGLLAKAGNSLYGWITPSSMNYDPKRFTMNPETGALNYGITWGGQLVGAVHGDKNKAYEIINNIDLKIVATPFDNNEDNPSWKVNTNRGIPIGFADGENDSLLYASDREVMMIYKNIKTGYIPNPCCFDSTCDSDEDRVAFRAGIPDSSKFSTIPVEVNGRVFVGSKNGYIHEYDTKGQLIDSLKVSNEELQQVLANDRKSELFVRTDSKVYKLNLYYNK